MKEDKIIGVILILFSAFMYFQTLDFPEAVFGTLGAGFFPRILFALLGLAGAGLIISRAIEDRKRRKKEVDGKASEVRTWEQFKDSVHRHSQVILSFFLVFGYVVIMDCFGYTISTLAFMLITIWYLGPKSRKEIPMILAISCGITFIIYFSFEKLLQIFLPEGILF